MTSFTLAHVVISLIGIASGGVVLAGLLQSRRLEGWTAVFLGTTVATSLTGFGFPATQVLPSHIVAGISLVVLAVAAFARYARGLSGGWRAVYVVSGGAALYLNVFVLVVQLFLKVPSLHALAPTGSEPPFAVAQTAVFAVFAGLIASAARRFRPVLAP
ncbi:MAG: hypothetical protein AB7H88_16030 [Vicinamibacterales bacterium]